MQDLTLRWLLIQNSYQFTQLYAFQNRRRDVESQTTSSRGTHSFGTPKFCQILSVPYIDLT